MTMATRASLLQHACTSSAPLARAAAASDGDSADALYHMDGKGFAGRRISVVVAAESRKRPEEMRHRSGTRGVWRKKCLSW